MSIAIGSWSFRVRGWLVFGLLLGADLGCTTPPADRATPPREAVFGAADGLTLPVSLPGWLLTPPLRAPRSDEPLVIWLLQDDPELERRFTELGLAPGPRDDYRCARLPEPPRPVIPDDLRLMATRGVLAVATFEHGDLAAWVAGVRDGSIVAGIPGGPWYQDMSRWPTYAFRGFRAQIEALVAVGRTDEARDALQRAWIAGTGWTSTSSIRVRPDSMLQLWRLLLDADPEGAGASVDRLIARGRAALGQPGLTPLEALMTVERLARLCALRHDASSLARVVREIDRHPEHHVASDTVFDVLAVAGQLAAAVHSVRFADGQRDELQYVKRRLQVLHSTEQQLGIAETPGRRDGKRRDALRAWNELAGLWAEQVPGPSPDQPAWVELERLLFAKRALAAVAAAPGGRLADVVDALGECYDDLADVVEADPSVIERVGPTAPLAWPETGR